MSQAYCPADNSEKNENGPLIMHSAAIITFDSLVALIHSHVITNMLLHKQIISSNKQATHYIKGHLSMFSHSNCCEPL